MDRYLENLSLHELTNLKEIYINNIKDIDKELKRRFLESISTNPGNEITINNNSDRLQKYLDTTNISNIKFLNNSLEEKGNNKNGPLSIDSRVLLDKNAEKIGKDYKIDSQKLSSYRILNHYHPIFNNDAISEAYKKAQFLSYLDEIFKDKDNCMNYLGAYTVFKYVKNYLENVLQSDDSKSDNELIYQDYEKKVEIVTENLVSIANELLFLRNSIPGSRISVNNSILLKTAHKKVDTQITHRQKNLIEAIAFGTSLEKLESKNYEDAKQLVFLPLKK